MLEVIEWTVFVVVVIGGLTAWAVLEREIKR